MFVCFFQALRCKIFTVLFFPISVGPRVIYEHNGENLHLKNFSVQVRRKAARHHKSSHCASVLLDMHVEDSCYECICFKSVRMHFHDGTILANVSIIY